MGLGPIMGIYQAHVMRYLSARGLIERGNRKVYFFCGDGEMDEPESKGAIGLAGRESLENLIFVINCNLQRLMVLLEVIIRLFRSSRESLGVLVGMY